MESLFRSETMYLYQIIVSNEAAFDVAFNLGEVATLQLKNLNAHLPANQQKFSNEIRRCNEMERKLRFLQSLIKKENIPIHSNVTENPHSKELNYIETTLHDLDRELREANNYSIRLKKNLMELIEMNLILMHSDYLFDDGQVAMSDSQTKEILSDQTFIGKAVATTHLGFMAGVIKRERLKGFEQMLWRYTRGTALLRTRIIEQPLEDPATGLQEAKSVFVVIFHGDHLKEPIRKICIGFRATLYACPETATERKTMELAVREQIKDLALVMSQSNQHRKRVLTLAANSLMILSNKIAKIKSIYFHLNWFASDVTQKCLVADAWCPVLDVQRTREALDIGTANSGSAMPTLFNRIETREHPPTFQRVNKFTEAFQVLIDAYGVANYREMNPAPYTIITFPFLFALMFGDWGHGILTTVFASWMVLCEKSLLAKKSTNEIWNIIFGGRYVVLLMGLFSIYTGFIYNDLFGKSVNFFGTEWRVHIDEGAIDNVKLDLDPKTDSTGQSYAAGVDPIWGLAHENNIIFLNSLKMKIAIIFGVTHMIFGVIIGVFNYTYFHRPSMILTTFIPQIIFLCFLFFYLVVLFFVKWFLYSTKADDVSFSEACAPSILITFIDMMLFKYPEEIEGECSHYMFPNQASLQKVLFVVAWGMVPIMLLAQPLWISYNRKEKSKLPLYESSTEKLDEEEEEEMSEIWIHQGIHTIEYVLGSISHTASYLRLWALSLAHSQLADVVWTMVLRNGLSVPGIPGFIALYFIFGVWAALTVSILVMMEGMSAFLHTLRLHWVEFQSKFYTGTGIAFIPFDLGKSKGVVKPFD